MLTVDASFVTSTSNTISVRGGNGADVFAGGAGRDSLLGGAGADTFNETVKGATIGDYINGGDGADNINIRSNNFTSTMTIIGGTGTDTVTITDAATIVDADFTNISTIEVLALGASSTGTITLGTIADANTLELNNSIYTVASLDDSAYTATLTIGGWGEYQHYWRQWC